MATYIEKKNPAPLTYEIDGAVSGLTASSFTMTPAGGAPLTINFTGTLAVGIVDGSVVEVEFSTFTSPPATITTTAGSIELKQELQPDNGDYVEVKGYVANLVAPNFTVDGIAVDAGSLSLASIANGTKVEVKGTFSAGTLMASSIEVK